MVAVWGIDWGMTRLVVERLVNRYIGSEVRRGPLTYVSRAAT